MTSVSVTRPASRLTGQPKQTQTRRGARRFGRLARISLTLRSDPRWLRDVGRSGSHPHPYDSRKRTGITTGRRTDSETEGPYSP
ncbi:hypothetical protein NHX12_010806 [Muraenolepis orangiensis]|uniref:Uncharacterized protein n=1 Tax=Muraenolepis orangiensis TaxID=630683 RepID=A0A9Q0DGN8_9TELE|nr:hypothetical protein NHX12_010806 [Muraenolepis orangiensis]